MPLIDTPAEGFPLPPMTPPTRENRLLNALRLSRGSQVRAMQRAGADVGDAIREGLEAGFADPDAQATGRLLRDILDAKGHPDEYRLTDRVPGKDEEPILDDEVASRIERVGIEVWHAPAPGREITTGQIGDFLADWRAREAREREQLVRAAFAGGRAYERGATLRRNVSAKSLGSRRVQAQGVAADYLRDDPQDGARLAALVLAGFAGADPETIR